MATSGSRWLKSATTTSWRATRKADPKRFRRKAKTPERCLRGFVCAGSVWAKLLLGLRTEIERRRLQLWNLDLDGVRIDRRQRALVVHYHGREHDHQQHHDDLDHDERHRAPIDLAGRDRLHSLAGHPVDVGLFWRHRAQIEQ